MMALLNNLPEKKEVEPPKKPQKTNLDPIVDCSHLDVFDEPIKKEGKKNRKITQNVQVEESYDNEEEKKVAEQYEK